MEFLNKFERCDDERNRFAPSGTAEEVLQPNILRRFFRSLGWPFTPDSHLTEDNLIEILKERELHRFVAILIFITCNVEAARTFTTELLVKEPFERDKYSLPVKLDLLRNLFGEEITPDKFVAQQAYFCPVVIHQGREELVENPERRRFPYLEEKLLAEGSFGTVYKVKIAKGHFYNHRYKTTTNPLPLEVARKDYVISSQFPATNKEHEVIEKILASDRSCENIVENFGSLSIGSKMYSLFMPLAICDLSTYMMNYHRAKPSTIQEKAAIILSARGLSRGLNFLHNEMKTRQGEDLVCYHMDLKPSNILVFQEGDRKIWKISDFGMARVKVRKRGSGSDKERDFNSWFVQRPKPAPEPTPTPTFNPHGEGTYLAPESLAAIASMKASSDVWSLGCVISVVFVYLQEGAGGVTEYQEQRSDHPKADGIDRFFLRDKGFGHFKMHPVVEEWHKKLILTAKCRDPHEGAALKSMLGFLENAVFRDQSKRCRVGELEDMLCKTYKAYSGLEVSRDLPSSGRPVFRNPATLERRPGWFTKQSEPLKNERQIGRWFVEANEPFKNCEISSDGSVVVFWSDTKLTLFTSSSLTSGKIEAKPQAEWFLESPSRILKNVRLTDRYLLASASGGTFRVSKLTISCLSRVDG